jgi:dihydroxy-acid dehydratase
VASFDNAITADMAIGGSTNAIVHLLAMAGRAGVPLRLERFDQISRQTPMLANIRPSGHYLMEDFYYAGGLRALLAQLGGLLDQTCRTVNGRTLGDIWPGPEFSTRKLLGRSTIPCQARGDGGSFWKTLLRTGQ